MNRNYSEAYDPDMTAAEFYGWPTRAEAEADAAEPMTGSIEPCGRCGRCLRCALEGLRQ